MRTQIISIIVPSQGRDICHLTRQNREVRTLLATSFVTTDNWLLREQQVTVDLPNYVCQGSKKKANYACEHGSCSYVSPFVFPLISIA